MKYLILLISLFSFTAIAEEPVGLLTIALDTTDSRLFCIVYPSRTGYCWMVLNTNRDPCIWTAKDFICKRFILKGIQNTIQKNNYLLQAILLRVKS